MHLTSILALSWAVLIECSIANPLQSIEFDNVTTQYPCPELRKIDNGHIKISDNGYQQIATIICDDGYDLDGNENIYCLKGKWDHYSRPECSKRCYPPPNLNSGLLEINGDKDENGLYHKGTLVTYTCKNGYYLSPEGSQYRVCEKGIWTGPYANCLPYVEITKCPPPKDLVNGYFVPEKVLKDGVVSGIGQRLHYSCNQGYVLNGPAIQQCLEDGTWSPKIPPVCTLAIPG